jgi:hypothetical protein
MTLQRAYIGFIGEIIKGWFRKPCDEVVDIASSKVLDIEVSLAMLSAGGARESAEESRMTLSDSPEHSRLTIPGIDGTTEISPVFTPGLAGASDPSDASDGSSELSLSVSDLLSVKFGSTHPRASE